MFPKFIPPPLPGGGLDDSDRFCIIVANEVELVGLEKVFVVAADAANDDSDVTAAVGK
jgi:hypothetical protein